MYCVKIANRSKSRGDVEQLPEMESDNIRPHLQQLVAHPMSNHFSIGAHCENANIPPDLESQAMGLDLP
jgi:hypothetical protein